MLMKCLKDCSFASVWVGRTDVAVIDFVTIMRILGCPCESGKKKGWPENPASPLKLTLITELAQLLRRARRRVRPSEPSPPNPSSDQVAGSGTAETVMVKVAGFMW